MMHQDYDKLLQIQTKQQNNKFYPSHHYHRYEATPYDGLELLLNSFPWTKTSQLVDFGCGKGRLSFFFHYHLNIMVKGVEMDTSLYEDALQNLAHYSNIRKKAAEKVEFFHCMAQEYPIDPKDNCFYFFNPFSTSIFMTVIKNILASLEESYHPIRLILYYPSPNYIFFLENKSPFTLEQEIVLPGQIEFDLREKFQIWTAGSELSENIV